MARIATIVGVTALTVTMAGCWEQPGYDAGHTRYNPDETALTAANVHELVELWSTDTGDAPVQGPLSVNGTIYAVTPETGSAPNRAVAVDAATGGVDWSTDLTEAASTTVNDPVHIDGRLVVPYEYFKWGGYATVTAGSGAVVADSAPNTGTWALAVLDGDLVTTGFGYGSAVPTPFGYTVDGPCTAGIGGLIQYDPQPRRDFAYVGSDLMWNRDTAAAGFVGCDPGTGQYANQWNTELGAVPTGVAAVGDVRVVYTAADGTLTLLDAASGAVGWATEVGTALSPPAVAGGTVFTTTADGRLVAVDAATGSVQWEATVGAPGTLAVAGDVVYVAPDGGSTVLAFDGDGCGNATCPSLASVPAGAEITSGPIVDAGRLVVGTADGHLAAFGLQHRGAP